MFNNIPIEVYNAVVFAAAAGAAILAVTVDHSNRISIGVVDMVIACAAVLGQWHQMTLHYFIYNQTTFASPFHASLLFMPLAINCTKIACNV